MGELPPVRRGSTIVVGVAAKRAGASNSDTVGVPGQMTVRVRLFALARQLANCDTVAVSVPERATVGDVRRGLAKACPPLAGLISRVLIAVDSEYADDATPVRADAEVACIPPVSGG